MSINKGVDKDMVHIYNGILLSHKKGWNIAICNNTDIPRDYHTKWSKSDKDKYNLLSWYVDTKEMIQINLFPK